jgi:hypothetical protein
MVTAVIGLFVAFGLVDNDHAQAIIGAAAVIIPGIWMIADAIIRHGRSRVLAGPPTIVVHAGNTPSAQIQPGESQTEVPDPPPGD